MKCVNCMNNEILLPNVRIDNRKYLSFNIPRMNLVINATSDIKSITFIHLKHQNTIKFFLLAMYFQYFISHINDFEYE